MSVTTKIASSSAFSAASKLLSKALGVISTIALARILAPQEFGLIALVSIVLYLFDILSNSASEQYIIQKNFVSSVDLDTAWTANFLLKCLFAIFFVLLASSIATFFNKPELHNAFMVSSLILPINALKSPAFILLKRQLRFSIIFRATIIERLVAVPLVIFLAITLKSFWAFIYTDLFACLFAVLLSYILTPRKPRLSLKNIGQQWFFSKWMLLKSVVGYLRSQVDTVIVSKVFPAAELGNYHMAREVSMMPAHYLLGPALEPLLSALKEHKNNDVEMHASVSFTIYIILIVSIPTCFFIVERAASIVNILLGEGWGLATELLPILSMLFVYWIIMLVIETCLIAQGKVRFVFFIDIISLATICFGLYLCILSEASIATFGWVRGGAGLAIAILLVVYIFKRSLSTLLQLSTSLFLILTATMMSILALKFIDNSTLSLFQNNTTITFYLIFFGEVILYFSIYLLMMMSLHFIFAHYHSRKLLSVLRELKTKNR